jgi:hypothetical protein
MHQAGVAKQSYRQFTIASIVDIACEYLMHMVVRGAM